MLKTGVTVGFVKVDVLEINFFLLHAGETRTSLKNRPEVFDQRWRWIVADFRNNYQKIEVTSFRELLQRLLIRHIDSVILKTVSLLD